VIRSMCRVDLSRLDSGALHEPRINVPLVQVCTQIETKCAFRVNLTRKHTLLMSDVRGLEFESYTPPFFYSMNTYSSVVGIRTKNQDL